MPTRGLLALGEILCGSPAGGSLRYANISGSVTIRRRNDCATPDPRLPTSLPELEPLPPRTRQIHHSRRRRTDQASLLNNEPQKLLIGAGESVNEAETKLWDKSFSRRRHRRLDDVGED